MSAFTALPTLLASCDHLWIMILSFLKVYMVVLPKSYAGIAFQGHNTPISTHKRHQATDAKSKRSHQWKLPRVHPISLRSLEGLIVDPPPCDVASHRPVLHNQSQCWVQRFGCTWGPQGCPTICHQTMRASLPQAHINWTMTFGMQKIKMISNGCNNTLIYNIMRIIDINRLSI